MKPVQRLNRRSISILESYHQDTDSAIETMHSKLCDQGAELEKLRLVARSFGSQAPLTAANFDDTYWKRVKGEVRNIIEEMRS